MRKFIYAFLFLGMAVAAPAGSFGLDNLRMPMKENTANSLYSKWLEKEVFESVKLHDMESLDGWSTGGQGEIELTRERAIDGGNLSPVPGAAAG